MLYSVATEVGRAVFNAVAEVERDYTDQDDLKVVLLFVALGLSLTAAICTLGFGVEIGEILAASG